MKTTLKLFGLALVAGALLFVACKKDENETQTNNGSKPDTTTPAPKPDTDTIPGPEEPEYDPADTIPSITIMFDDELAVFSNGKYGAYVDDSANPILFLFQAYNEDGDGNKSVPNFSIYMQYDTLQANMDDRWNINFVYYSDDVDHYNAVKPFGEYMYKDMTGLMFRKFTTSPVVISFDAIFTMGSYYELVKENVPESDVTTKELVVRAKNIRFVNQALRSK